MSNSTAVYVPSAITDIRDLNKYIRLNRFRSLVNGQPCLPRGQAYDTVSNGTAVEHNAQWQWQFPYQVSNLRLVYGNFYCPGSGAMDDSTSPLGDITINAKLYRAQGVITFRGATSVVLKPGTIVESDPIPYILFPGQKHVFRNHVTCASGVKWPLGASTVSGDTEGAESGTGLGDKTASGTITASTTAAYGPCAFLGNVEGVNNVVPISLGIVGDSISRGTGDLTASVADYGPFVRLATLIGCPWHRAAAGGDSATSLTNLGVFPTTMANGSQYNYMRLNASIRGCTHVTCFFGANDLATISNTPTQCMQSLLFVWRQLATMVPFVLAFTIAPRGTNGAPFTSSFDPGGASTRAVINAWLRDGAPITITGNNTFTPATTGDVSAGVIRAGNLAHPLAFYPIDTCLVWENGVNTNNWVASYTADNTHPNNAGALALANYIYNNYLSYFQLTY
jgi:lysophospholipase L1-like esterase